ncbi:cellulase family glycosylhydrolase [Carboxylicivirga linearis]|uniref:Cellulase family glycosylhydrolase n=1 Tax=Carboxylicivirga linearis TaxID=1628157 RepID=A0ABS5JX17_9BACT|nr:cellulase family glycosylhydrolase [Carboxylicivirga linearis]MBS2099358.1 cellulase family glycosylhydrolase [Carboxylicivirga linearis]
MKVSKRYWFISFVLLFFIGCDTSTQKEFFTVNDGKLLDANGQEFVIRGMNVPHAWFPDQSYEALNELTKYNVNCVRIVWESGKEASELEKVVARCVDLQMIPMVELHNATGDSTETKLLEMVDYYTSDQMKNIIIKYEQYLLLNIANEWGDHTMTDEYWRDSYLKAIQKMRDAGYRTTLVIDASGWGQNISPIITYGKDLNDADPMHNILFSVHMYGSWNDVEKIRSNLRKVKQLKLPLIIGEFGYNFNEGDNNLACKVNHEVLLEECQNLQIGYLPWSWTGNNEANQWLDIVSREDWKSLTNWGDDVMNSPEGIKLNALKATLFD